MCDSVMCESNSIFESFGSKVSSSSEERPVIYSLNKNELRIGHFFVTLLELIHILMHIQWEFAVGDSGCSYNLSQRVKTIFHVVFSLQPVHKRILTQIWTLKKTKFNK